MLFRGLVAAVFCLGLSATACDKPSRAQCEEACWHQRGLHFWETAEFAISEAPESERAVLRKEKEADWEAIRKDPNAGSANVCIEQCKEHGKKSQLECIMKATTFEEANKCTR